MRKITGIHDIDKPREVFSDAIAERAASIVLIHNHPSGNTDPSHEDIAVTKRLVEAGEILGIKIHDHIIVSKDSHTSMLLVLTFSVVANGSSLAHVKNAGVSLSTLRLCDLATLRYIRGTQRRDDARAQRMKSPFFWHLSKKPQNQSESGMLEMGLI